MNAADGQDMLKNILGSVGALATTTFGSAADSAKQDAEALVTSIQGDISTWSQQLAAGEITADDLKWQIESKKDLAQMDLLKNAGIAQINIDEFKNGLFSIISSTLLSKIG